MAKKIGSVSVGNLEAFLGLDDTEFVRGINRAQSSLRSAGKMMQSVGRSMTTFITLPLLAAGGASLKLAADFESAMVKIQALTGTSREVLQGMRGDIFALARETGKAPLELAEGLYFILSSGFKASEALDVLDKSAKAAAIGLGSTQVVADGLTSVMNAYGHEAMSAAKATNILIATVNYGKAEADALANNIGYVVPIAAQMGIEFEEVGAAIAGMTLKGADASTAITNLRQILSDFLDPTKAARGAMEGWGKSAKEFRNILREDGLLTALGFLREEMKKDEEAFSKIFGNVRSLTGALSLMGTTSEQNVQILANLREHYNFLDNGMKAVANTAQFRFNQAMAELKIAGIQMGEALMPIFLDLVDVVKNMANWFSSLSEPGKRMVLTLGLIAGAAGPAAIALGSIATFLAAISFEIVAVVAGIAALAAGFIYLADNWEAIKERVTDWAWWKNAMIDMAQFVIEYNAFSVLAELAVYAFNTIIRELNTLIQTFVGKFNQIAKIVGVELKIGPIGPTSPAENPFRLLAESLEGLKSETKEYEHQFKSFWDSMKSAAQKATNWLFPKGGGGGGGGAIDPLPTGKTGMPGSGGAKASYTPTLSPLLGVFDEKVLAQMKRMRVEADLLAESFESTLTNAITSFASTLGDAFASIGTGQKNFLETLARGTQSIIEMFLQQSIAAMIAAHMMDPKTMAFPFLKVALAAAGIVAVRALFGQVQGLDTGGYVTSGGVFQLHKDEMVSLPVGSAVTPAHMVNGGGGGNLTTEISLRKLIIELDRERERMGR